MANHFYSQFIITLLVILLGQTTPGHSSTTTFLDGTWQFQSSTKKGSSVQSLPPGDTISLKILGPKGEVVVTPGNPGVVETLIKSLCTKLYGTGKISYELKKSKAAFKVSDVTGAPTQSFCPAAKLLGQLAGKGFADQLEKGSLKLNFDYKVAGDQLILTTLYKKESLELTFKKQ